MKRIIVTALTGTLLASATYAENLRPLFARSAAMGDTGVANADAIEAVYYNPALLAGADKTITLSLPTLGVRSNNPEDLIDEIDKIQEETMVAYENATTAGEIQTAAGLLRDNMVAIQREQMTIGLSGNLVVSGNLAGMGIALSSVSTAKVIAAPVITDTDIATLTAVAAGSPQVPVSSLTSQATALAIGVQEIGLTLAKKNDKVRWGVTPKIVRVTSYDYTRDLDIGGNNFDFDDVDSSDVEENDSDFNLDLGVAYTPSKLAALTVGLTAKNIFEQEYETVTGREYELEPQLVAGLAWSPANVTVTADLELLSTEEVLTEEDIQRLGLGVETNLGIAALRAGYRTNVKDGSEEDVLSLGIGMKGGPIKADLSGQFLDDEAAAVFQFALLF